MLHAWNSDIPHMILSVVDSTNAYSKKRLKEGAEPPFLVTTERQTRGRGRLGKSFFSPEGGLYMSLALQYGGSEEQTTLAAAAAVCRVLERHCDAKFQIKWVNDILVEGKKVCGILCEAVCGPAGRIDAVIVGVGINTGQCVFPEDIRDIASTVHSSISNEALAEEIAKEILQTISLGAACFQPEYEARLCDP